MFVINTFGIMQRNLSRPVIKLVSPKRFGKKCDVLDVNCWQWIFVTRCIDNNYLAVIIIELAYFVEFKTFTIIVPVCPFNWIFLYVFHF